MFRSTLETAATRRDPYIFLANRNPRCTDESLHRTFLALQEKKTTSHLLDSCFSRTREITYGTEIELSLDDEKRPLFGRSLRLGMTCLLHIVTRSFNDHCDCEFTSKFWMSDAGKRRKKFNCDVTCMQLWDYGGQLSFLMRVIISLLVWKWNGRKTGVEANVTEPWISGIITLDL